MHSLLSISINTTTILNGTHITASYNEWQSLWLCKEAKERFECPLCFDEVTLCEGVSRLKTNMGVSESSGP